MEVLHNNSGGQYFKPKNIAFETTKSVALAGTISAAIFHAISRFPVNNIAGGSLAGSVAFGALIGGLFGHSKYSATTIYNNKANTLNKYQEDPLVQGEILSEVGGMGYIRNRGKAESLLWDVNIGSLVAEFGYNVLRRSKDSSFLSKALESTSYLSALGWAVTRVISTNHDVKREDSKLLYAEKVALQRADNIMAPNAGSSR